MFVLVPQHFCSVQLDYRIRESLALPQTLMGFIHLGSGPGSVLILKEWERKPKGQSLLPSIRVISYKCRKILFRVRSINKLIILQPLYCPVKTKLCMRIRSRFLYSWSLQSQFRFQMSFFNCFFLDRCNTVSHSAGSLLKDNESDPHRHRDLEDPPRICSIPTP